MTSTVQDRPSLLVYKEITDGDRRKFLAASNDSQSGGGARDLRLPWKSFRPVMGQIFDTDGTGKGGTAIRTGVFRYLDGATPRTTVLEYWPATTSRPSEDRVARVHASPALGGRLPDDNRGRVFVLFIKFASGIRRCAYAYEDDLRAGRWAPEVTTAILGCMASIDMKNASRVKNKMTVMGFHDFTQGMTYCHGE